MPKTQLLVVDADKRSLAVMEVSLRDAGFSVTGATDGQDALNKLAAQIPDLLLADTKLPDMDGFDLCRRVRSQEKLERMPFVFLTRQRTIADKIRGLEAGADDYLTKPIYIKEIVARIRQVLEREDGASSGRTGPLASFAGNLADVTLVELVQALDTGRKSGTLRLDLPGRAAAARVWFREGKVVDAELGSWTAEAAFYRILPFAEGTFAIDFGPVDRGERIALSAQTLLQEGVRRMDERGKLLRKLPPLPSVLELDYELLAEKLPRIPDEVNALLRLLDGRRSLVEIVDEAPFDELMSLELLGRLFVEGMLKKPAAGSAAAAAGQVATWVGATPKAEAPVAAVARSAPESPPVEPIVVTEQPTPIQPAAVAPAAAAPLPATAAEPTPAAAGEAVVAEPAPPDAPAPATPSPRPLIVRFPSGRRSPGGDGAAAEAFLAHPGEATREEEESAEANLDLAPASPRSHRATIGVVLAVLAVTIAAFLVLGRAKTPPEVPVAVPAPRPVPQALAPVPPSHPTSAPPAVAPAAGSLAPAAAPAKSPPPRAPAPAEKLAAASPGAGHRMAEPKPATTSSSATTAPAAGNPKAAPASESYEAALSAGEAKYRRGAIRGAIAEFRKAVATRPDSAVALAALGSALYEAGQSSAAVQPLEKALAVDPKNSRACLTLGTLYQTEGQNAKAIQMYQRYLSVEPHGQFAGDVRTILKSLH